jgi:rhodanese-related sulfurtransferase
MKKVIAFIAVGIMGITGAFAGEYPDVSIKEVKEAIKGKTATIIDVNGAESYAKGHVPGAIDYSASKSDLAKVLPKEKDALIIAYCGGPACSAYQAAAKAAKDLGYTNVKHMSAGISGWTQAGEKTEAAKGKKERKNKKEKKDAQ